MDIQLRASSSFSSVPFSTRSYTHDVFLSFRGEDTRYGFTGYLHRSLVEMGIKTFIDDQLPRGEEISETLLRAIEGSKLSLIVFSENYASSKWCLDELVHILGCRRSKKQMVRPIFYKVDPSDVRHQTGKFGEAVAEHERRFKDDMDKVLRWRAALSEAANLSGLRFSGTGYEYAFIDKIVEEITAQVKEPIYLDMPKCQVGLDSRVEHILEMLDVGGSDVRMVGIWGIGGIGKTTIAKAVHNTIVHKFDGSCFLANVREGSEQQGGLVNLQNILLSKIVGQKELKIYNIHEGITLLRERLREKRILLIVDDVDNLDQLEKLAGGTDWFGHGSRVIITTRDNGLLIAHQVKPIYEVPGLGHHEALKLFSSNAFKDNKNLDDNEKLSVTTVVKYAQGIPLALEVLSSYLCDTSIHKWQVMLDGFKKNPPRHIQDILKVSYDGLGKKEKEVFLDIACFFKGWNTNDVIQILEGCDRINCEHSIKVLEEKALIYRVYGQICMHDLLEEMGKDKVLEESTEPGKRSRLWHHKDVQDVLTENTGTSKIEGMMVKMPKEDEIRLSPKCFKKMKNLKIFINVNGQFCGKVDYYPNKLRLLDWFSCPLQSLPSNFNMKNLVQLNMPCSRISRFGEGSKSMENLKSLNLGKCEFLVQSPDLSGSPNLEFLDLNWCTSLKKIHPSIGSLQKLFELDLNHCSNLVTLPQKVNCRSLKSLTLCKCKLLAQSPDLSGSPNLESLDLSYCKSLVEVHPSVGSLKKLVQLNMPCSRISRFGEGSKSMENLKSLNLGKCEFLVQSPDLSGSPNLEFLDLNCCKSLVEVHPSVGSLKKLVQLDLENCSKLEMLPGEVNWRSLQKINLNYCTRLESFPEIVEEMKYMTSLRLWRTGIKALPSSIGYLINLEGLELQSCGNLTDLPWGIYELHKLRSILVRGCPKLVTFPNKVESEVLPTSSTVSHDNRDSSSEPEPDTEFNLALPCLDRFHAFGCNSSNIDFLASLDCASTLENLDFSGSPIVILPECINKFVKLRTLNLRGCTRLVEIPELPPSIKRLDVRDCVSLERISKLSNILERKESQIMIEEMNLTNCWRLCQNLVEMANKDDDEVHADLFSRLLSSQQSKFTITFPVPRSEVPKWFSCQMDFKGHRRFEFCIETLANFKWDNTGLALCVAVDQKLQLTDFEVHIHMNEVHVSTLRKQLVDSAESDHVWLHYVPFLVMWPFDYMRPLPPFTCRVIIYQRQDSEAFLKSCGVHLVMPPNEDVCMKLIRAENLTSKLSLGELYKYSLDKYRPKQRTDCKELYTDAQQENEKL